MKNVRADTQDVKEHLAKVIRRSKRTQLNIQKPLGWGRSYISQMLTGQKVVSLDSLFAILGELRISPADFFGELYEVPHGSELAGLRKTLDEHADRLADLENP